MSLESHGFGDWTLGCDTCSEGEEFDHTRFDEVREYMNDNGWRSFKKGGEWNHKCPSCIEDGK